MKFDFETVYYLYPRKIGKKIGIERCKRFIKTEEQYSDLLKALDNYRRYCTEESLEPRFIKHFSSWMNSYEDWISDDAGTVSLAKKEEKWKNETIRLLKDG